MKDMTKQKLYEKWKNLGELDFDKSLFIEYVSLCNFMSDDDFHFYLNPDKATDAEFFSVLDFLYQQDCYILLYRFLRDNQKRIIFPDFSIMDGIKIRADIEKRFEKYYF